MMPGMMPMMPGMMGMPGMAPPSNPSEPHGYRQPDKLSHTSSQESDTIQAQD